MLESQFVTPLADVVSDFELRDELGFFVPKFVFLGNGANYGYSHVLFSGHSVAWVKADRSTDWLQLRANLSYSPMAFDCQRTTNAPLGLGGQFAPTTGTMYCRPCGPAIR